MEYELTFVVSDETVDDDEAVDKLRDSLDAMLHRAGGLDLLTIAFEGDAAVNAAFRAITAISSVAPKIRIHRLDRDLVGIPEIAERAERTRQNVTQWIKGERKSDGPLFPAPEGTAGRASVWLWSEVNEWLKHHGMDDGLHYPNRDEMALIDHAILTSKTLTMAFDAPEDDFLAQRLAVASELQTHQLPTGFLDYLAERTTIRDNQGRHVIVVASAEEPAAGVMERITRHGHDVVLTTVIDQFVGILVSTQPPHRPVRLVNVPLHATVRDWVKLILDNPGAGFVLSSAGEVRPIETVLRNAA
jgi:predicted DNA-binding transcriptional regulator AlpA